MTIPRLRSNEQDHPPWPATPPGCPGRRAARGGGLPGAASGRSDTVQLLARVVEVQDAHTGTVQLKRRSE
ncbi:hypothetical protein AB0H83_39830, partial [Dactylosporangium sp. NPDC050688]|uniref:hypothetical protein n=1 Tax=Dactylosporangium sp. NPDC050688 TaxID=3157217 RepID=UPI0033CE3B25